MRTIPVKSALVLLCAEFCQTLANSISVIWFLGSFLHDSFKLCLTMSCMVFGSGLGSLTWSQVKFKLGSVASGTNAVAALRVSLTA